MKTILKELKAFFESTFAFTRGYVIIEVIFIALLSVASSQVNCFLSSWSLLILVSILVLIITYVQRFDFLNKFPKSLIDAVQQSIDYKDLDIKKHEFEIEALKLEKSKERNSLINDAISDTIVGLNSQTCTLHEKEDPFPEIIEKLCDKDVEDGLIRILSPFASEIYTIIQGHNPLITIGAYFRNVAQEPTEVHESASDKAMLFVIKDDNNIKSKVPSNLLEDSMITGDLQNLQQLFETCLRNNRFVKSQITLFLENYSIIVSPIPFACDENDASGAVFLLLKNDVFPNDIEKIIKIFTRLLTNWMYKYNNCVYSKCSDIYLELPGDGKEFEKLKLLKNGRYIFTPIANRE